MSSVFQIKHLHSEVTDIAKDTNVQMAELPNNASSFINIIKSIRMSSTCSKSTIETLEQHGVKSMQH